MRVEKLMKNVQNVFQDIINNGRGSGLLDIKPELTISSEKKKEREKNGRIAIPWKSIYWVHFT